MHNKITHEHFTNRADNIIIEHYTTPGEPEYEYTGIWYNHPTTGRRIMETVHTRNTARAIRLWKDRHGITYHIHHVTINAASIA